MYDYIAVSTRMWIRECVCLHSTEAAAETAISGANSTSCLHFTVDLSEVPHTCWPGGLSKGQERSGEMLMRGCSRSSWQGNAHERILMQQLACRLVPGSLAGR